jgi:hypothetical protein
MLDGCNRERLMRGDEWEHENIFINKTVRLVKSDGFVLTGKILKINKNNLLLRQTKQPHSSK